jgi:four helix bundle protein
MGAVDMKSFRELMVWREAVELVVDCYHLAELLPRGERFGIVAQLKRCATSIPANIAEGHGRRRPKAVETKDRIRSKVLERAPKT